MTLSKPQSSNEMLLISLATEMECSGYIVQIKAEAHDVPEPQNMIIHIAALTVVCTLLPLSQIIPIHKLERKRSSGHSHHTVYM